MWKSDAEVLPHVAVPDKPLVHQCVQQHPDVLPACVVTSAMAMHSSSSERKDDDFKKMPKSSTSASCAGSEISSNVNRETVHLSREKLIDAQKVDVSLASVFQLASC